MMDTLNEIEFAVTGKSAVADRAGPLLAAIELAREGDHGAFTELVAMLHPLVHRWALSFARDADDADEIAQETFVLVHRRIHQYRGKVALEGWVYLITRNVALARKRKANRRKWLTESEIPGMATVYTTDPGARVDRQRVTEFIQRFFVTLPPRQREVFDLVDLQGHDPVEVAKLIGSRPGAVRANLFKARASIRAHILETHPAWKEVDR